MLMYKNGAVQKVAAEALAKVDPNWRKSEAARAAIPTFMAALKEQALKEQDSAMLEGAAEALGEIGDKRAIEPLVAALPHKYEKVQEAILKALAKIDPNWGKSEAAWAAVPVLVAVLKDKESSVRQAAAQALGRIGDEHAIEPLVMVLNDHHYTTQVYHTTHGEGVYYTTYGGREEHLAVKTNRAAAEALAKIDPNWRKSEAAQAAVLVLLSALKDEQESLRQATIWALGQIGDTRATNPLIEALKDKQWKVREIAAEALGGCPRIREEAL